MGQELPCLIWQHQLEVMPGLPGQFNFLNGKMFLKASELAGYSGEGQELAGSLVLI